ncbi:golgi-body localization protein domain-containing protein [Myxozyma melibiosi]|uniref:Golgi-body localization protein domain-containing protein n=1 Tax=Myxozyma melibiosi TaxID=54550 RepID=A0ABR1EYE9_9ASCO
MQLPEGISLLAAELVALICFTHIVAFVLFAVIRILTGVSIQRLGYFSLRHISFTLPSGILIEIRRIQLAFHRPAFARPSWLTLTVADVSVYFDPIEDSTSTPVSRASGSTTPTPAVSPLGSPTKDRMDSTPSSPTSESDRPRKKKQSTWKETIKRLTYASRKLHKLLKYLRLLDLSIKNVTLIAEDIGKMHIRSLAVSVDSIEKNSKFFGTVLAACSCDSIQDAGKYGVVCWKFAVKDVFYEPDDSPAEELLDVFQFELLDVFKKETLLTVDLSLNVRVGNITVPYDTFSLFHERLDLRKRRLLRKRSSLAGGSFPQKLEAPTAEEENPSEDLVNGLYLLVDAVREVRVHVAKVGVYKFSPECDYLNAREQPVYFSLSTKDFTIDLRRLNQNSPGHRMFFPRQDVSHQAIMTAISITVGLDDTKTGAHDELVYVPMITMTSTTNVLRKALDIFTGAETDRNSSLLKGSLSINSPAVDVRARHLPLFISMLLGTKKQNDKATVKKTSQARIPGSRIRLVELLPRTIIKLSIEEPGARVKLDNFPVPKVTNAKVDLDEPALLASTCSIINCEIESSHTLTPYPHYSLTMSFRMTEFTTWLRGPTGRYELVKTESLSLKTIAETSPQLDVSISGTLSSLSIFLTRPENVNGLKDIFSRLRGEVRSLESASSKSPDLEKSDKKMRKNPLRLLPSWISRIRLDGSDILMCASSKDHHQSASEVKDIARGLALQTESFIIDYKSNSTPRHRSSLVKRHQRTNAHADSIADLNGTATEFPHAIETLGAKSFNGKSGRRKLAVGFRCIDVCTMDTNDIIEQTTPLVHIPDVEVAIVSYATESKQIVEVNALLKKMVINYSLFHHYSMLLAVQAIMETVSPVEKGKPKAPKVSQPSDEVLYLDFRSRHIRIKADLPLSPPLMIESVGLEYSKRADHMPIISAKFFRMFVETTDGSSLWERFIVLRHLRVELARKRPRLDLKVPALSTKQETPVEAVEDDIVIGTDALSLSVPPGLLVYELVEGIVTSFKAIKQLTHEFKYDSDEYVLKPTAKEPVKMPRVRLRSKVIEMRLDDDPFEARLGIIFTVGMIEMKSRLAREAAFEAKVQALKIASTRKPSLSHDPTLPPDPEEPLKRKHTFKSMKGMKHHKNPRLKRATPIRYTPTEAEMPSDSAEISTEEAYTKLKELHSSSWIRRITRARRIRATTVMSRRHNILGSDGVDVDLTSDEKIVSIPDSPPLFQILFSDPDILLSKPSFPLEKVHTFLHDVGKGVPENTIYSLLVPFYWCMEMTEFRILLRDYPLPFVHVPSMNNSQAAKGPAWCLKSDFVIAEELFDEASSRYIQCPIVPRVGESEDAYYLTVTRTIAAVKMYSNINIDIATSSPTRITWAPSLQPAIQQTMMRFDTMTKPPVDPSPKVGFWDKIRLIFHSKIRFSWIDGAVHLLLKGSRDPYSITGTGAGFAMCWENNVTFDINPTGNQQDFMVVDSEQFLLAVPDFNYYVRQLNSAQELVEDSLSTHSDYQTHSRFNKVVMKLSGNVRWKAGLLFERDQADGTRAFESVPHYTVQLRRPDSVDPSKQHDSYAGFRSDYIHLALSVTSPRDEQWSPSARKQLSHSVNSIHLSPRAFTHFFQWWDLFAGEMSLPVRNGELFPPIMVSKKFGRHLATIKYQFALRSFSVSHVYLYKRDEDMHKKVMNSVGIKGRIDSFMMDLHQRREFITYTDKVTNQTRKRRKMRLNVGELDFQSADIRGVTASFKERSAEELATDVSGLLAENLETNYSEESPFSNSFPMAKLKVSDNDLTWVDIDDYRELDSFCGTANLTSVKVLPLIFTPRFTYYRQTEHAASGNGDQSGVSTSSFGNEPSHSCLLRRTDTVKFQTDLISARARELEEQIVMNAEQIEEYRRSARLSTADHFARQRFLQAKKDAELLELKRHTLHQLWFSLLQSTGHMSEADVKKHDDYQSECCKTGAEIFGDDKLDLMSNLQSLRSLEDESFSDFNNRFIFHNVQIKWSNSVRNVFLRYIHQIGQRKGLIYYMSRRAVKFIDDLDKERKKNVPDTPIAAARASFENKKSKPRHSVSSDTDELRDLEDRVMSRLTPAKSKEEVEKLQTDTMIEYLLSDAKQHLVVADPENGNASTSGAHHHHHDHHHHEDGSSGNGIAPEDTSFADNEAAYEEDSASSDSDGSDDEFESDEASDNKMLENLAAQYVARSSYVIRLLGPQIQLQSEVNPDSTLLVTSQNIELKIISIMDKSELEDDVSGLVQSRYSAHLDNAQFFVFHKSDLIRQSHWLFANSEYGSSRVYTGIQKPHQSPMSSPTVEDEPAATCIWPPWVPLESIYEGSALKSSRIAERTSASLLYDKHNSLRLKYGDKVTDQAPSINGTHSIARQVDQLSVDFPKVVAFIDSLQYYAVYIIVMDLLIYSEPHSKKSNERLEKILLATDFSDLSGAAEMVETLQREIRQLEEIKTQFLVYSSELDEQSWSDLRNVIGELRSAQSELFYIMKAITISQRRREEKKSATTGTLQWLITGQQIIAHLLIEDRTPFVDIALAKGSFRRLENSDGSNYNTIEIDMLQGINLLKGALYPEMLSPYFEGMKDTDKKRKAVRIDWYMLEAIGGIPVMDHLEVDLIPLKIQLEYDIGQKLFQYIFPNQAQSPLQVPSAIPAESSGSVATGATGDGRRGSPTVPQTGSAFSSSSDSEDADDRKSLRSMKDNNSSQMNLSMSSDTRSIHSTHSFVSRHRPVVPEHKAQKLRLSSTGSTMSLKEKNSDTVSLRSFNSAASDMSKAHTGVSGRVQSFEQNLIDDDDLSKMVTRASNFTTFVYVTIPSVVLCISYKGKGSRNIEDVNEFVFRLPTIEYRNKTWSNLDLALRMKKDIIKALISHTGALIENKIKRRQPNSRKVNSGPLIRQISEYAAFTSLADLSETRINKE